MWLTAKCYLVQNEANENEDDKYSCKGVSKKHNDLHFQHYKDVLDVFLKQGGILNYKRKILTRLRMWALGSMIRAL